MISDEAMDTIEVAGEYFTKGKEENNQIVVGVEISGDPRVRKEQRKRRTYATFGFLSLFIFPFLFLFLLFFSSVTFFFVSVYLFLLIIFG